MVVESIIGLGILAIAFVGYALTQVNWPMIQFCMRGDV